MSARHFDPDGEMIVVLLKAMKGTIASVTVQSLVNILVRPLGECKSSLKVLLLSGRNIFPRRTETEKLHHKCFLHRVILKKIGCNTKLQCIKSQHCRANWIETFHFKYVNDIFLY